MFQDICTNLYGFLTWELPLSIECGVICLSDVINFQFYNHRNNYTNLIHTDYDSTYLANILCTVSGNFPGDFSQSVLAMDNSDKSTSLWIQKEIQHMYMYKYIWPFMSCLLMYTFMKHV